MGTEIYLNLTVREIANMWDVFDCYEYGIATSGKNSAEHLAH
ncbi:hypothetical protein ZEAMMB73_Zm00001d002469 [Zea mays]|uniref:Uncharacterized protein n=1 Tax=Zea mays TaxID=4577 RepID=A0A1D6E1E7_MAIZE|nr:hypothetical protein ZEAMMB73_Zm00001d002469 [Zea mays]